MATLSLGMRDKGRRRSAHARRVGLEQSGGVV